MRRRSFLFSVAVASLLLFFFPPLLSAATTSPTSSPSPSLDEMATSPRTTHSLNHNHQHHMIRSCGSFRSRASLSLCTHFHQILMKNNQQMRRRFKPLSPPGEDIDPLYGVEKRLVPSGPNPLHN